MKVLDYIKEFGIDKLAEEFAIKIKRYPDGVIMLNYDQLNSPSSHPIVMECRSLILHLPSLTVMSRAFDRFFNHGETPAVNKAFCYDGFIAWEKIDGSLIPVYWNFVTDKWEIATKGTAYGEGWADPDRTITFKNLILKSIFNNDEELFQKVANELFDKQMTHCFEFAGPSSPHHTPYEADFLAGLSVRHTASGEYLAHDLQAKIWTALRDQHGLPVRTANRWEFSSEDEMLTALKSIRGLQEGFVLEDKVSGMRMKAKTKGFLAAMHLRSTGEVNPLRAATLVVTGEASEWLAYNPQDREIFDPLIQAYYALRSDIISAWAKVEKVEDPKVFAQQAKDYVFSSILFLARKQNILPTDVLEAMPELAQAKLLLEFRKKLSNA